MLCEKCEVKFFHRKVLINSQAIKVSLLEKGFLDILTEKIATMPMFKGKWLNTQVRPIKKDMMSLDFRNDKILVEVC